MHTFLRVVLFLLFSSATLQLSNGDQSVAFDAQKLFVATIIDPTNDAVMRDALTLIRSVRLFGGSLNNASFCAAITSSIDEALFIQPSLLNELHSLDVVVQYVEQKGPRMPKTLNKFEAFKIFDASKFSYFLWLDADIVVFQDPIPYFSYHQYPGEIQCVPELYSYMRRYPAVNTSVAFWNPSLPPFVMIGDNELAPHGTCNTGVVFFDSVSLGRFLEGIEEIEHNEQINELYKKDRFLDSLYFIYAINTRGISVSLFPFSLNFMAMFEVNIREDVKEDSIVFAHLLSDTEMYCRALRTSSMAGDTSSSSSFVVEEGSSGSGSDSASEDDLSTLFRTYSCTCEFFNELVQPNSLLVRYMQTLLSPFETCMKMAGAMSIAVETESEGRSRRTYASIHSAGSADAQVALDNALHSARRNVSYPSFTYSGSTPIPLPAAAKSRRGRQVIQQQRVSNWSIDCQLLSPAGSASDSSSSNNNNSNTEYASSYGLHITFPDDTIRIPVKAYCVLRRDVDAPYAYRDVEASIVLKDGGVNASDDSGPRIEVPCIQTEGVDAVSSCTTRSIFRTLRGDELVLPVLYSFYSIDVDYRLPDDIEVAAQITLFLKLNIHMVGGENLEMKTMQTTLRVQVFIDSLLPTEYLQYASNPLITNKPLPLPSQQHISQHLNARRLQTNGKKSKALPSGDGVVLCCNSWSGLAATKQLITDWRTDGVLFISVTASPYSKASVIENMTSEHMSALGLPPMTAGAKADYDWRQVSISMIGKDLQRVCDSRKPSSSQHDKINGGLRCIISLTGGVSSSGHINIENNSMFPLLDVYNARSWGSNNNRLALVYVDVFSGYNKYVATLLHWFGKLGANGIMLGSRATSSPLNPTLYNEDESRASVGAFSGNPLEETLVDIRTALQEVSEQLRLSYLLTHEEWSGPYCQNQAASYAANAKTIRQRNPSDISIPASPVDVLRTSSECMPAWWFIKASSSSKHFHNI